MRHDHSRRSRRVMTKDIVDRLLESLRPTRHLLTQSLADIPIGCAEYRQVNRVVQEIRHSVAESTNLNRPLRRSWHTRGHKSASSLGI